MALYNVIRPAIVAGKHYTRPSKSPVEVSDREAKALVDEGVLVPVPADGDHVHGAPEPAARRGKRKAEDES